MQSLHLQMARSLLSLLSMAALAVVSVAGCTDDSTNPTTQHLYPPTTSQGSPSVAAVPPLQPTHPALRTPQPTQQASPSARPTPKASPSPSPLLEQLTFTGFLQGQMTQATNPSPPTPSQPSKIGEEFPAKTRCGAWSDSFGSYWQADIVGKVGGANWALSMSYDTSSSGPTTFQITAPAGYNSADANVWLLPSTSPPGANWEAGFGATGSFTVSSDLRHGSIDVVLPGLTNDGTSTTIHVVGQWRCA